MRFHNLGHLEEFRERCKESGAQTQGTNDDLQNALVLNRESGHPKIGGSCDCADEDDWQSQTVVPLAVVMHAMRM